jgi:hypothetical protein
MENYIMLDGRKFEIDEKNSLLLRAVVGEENNKEKKNPFERVKTHEETYFYMNDWNCVEEDFDDDFEVKSRYNVANYCTDKGLMIQRALHETLNRLLWRFSEENGGDSDWDGEKNYHYYISYNINEHSFFVSFDYFLKGNREYFSSKEIAKQAIEKIVKPFIEEHPDFVW